MVKFVIIRHGYSLFNKTRQFSGQYDVPLTETGLKQAEITAKYVLDNYKIDVIYSSDLSRAIKTATPIATALNLPIIKEKMLREANMGIWETKTRDEVEKEYPEALKTYYEDTDNVYFQGGEKYVDLLTRSSQIMDKIAKENEGKTILISTHSGFVRGFVCFLKNIKFKEFGHVPNASVTEIDYSAGKAEFIKIGYKEHLKDLVTGGGAPRNENFV